MLPAADNSGALNIKLSTFMGFENLPFILSSPKPGLGFFHLSAGRFKLSPWRLDVMSNIIGLFLKISNTYVIPTLAFVSHKDMAR